MSRSFKVALAPLVLLLLILLFNPGIFALTVSVFAGWAFSLARLLRSVRLDFESLMLPALALVILVAGSHGFARWLHASAGSATNPETAAHWRWRWTLSGFGILFLTLLAIGSGILATHQVFWLSKSSEPWFVALRGQQLFLMGAANQLQIEATKEDWDREKAQEAFLRLELQNKIAWEELDPIWVEAGSNRLSAIVLIPRKPASGQPARFILIRPEVRWETLPLEKLPSVLGSLGLGLGAENPLSR
jgi:hypothetical protein